MAGIRDRVVEIAVERGRFSPEAYLFTHAALDFTLARRLKRGIEGHIDGRELLVGIRDFGVEAFGYLGRAVFEAWGLAGSADFGRIVFDLVEGGVLAKQETDTLDDFAGGFDFAEAFESKFAH